MYDPYAMDRFRFEQSKLQEMVGDPRPTRAQAKTSRRIAEAEARLRRAPEPCTD